jgi:hypothetical protein
MTWHGFSPGVALRHGSHVMVQVEHQMNQMERVRMMTTAETLDEDRQLVVMTILTDGADPLALLCKTK